MAVRYYSAAALLAMQSAVIPTAIPSVCPSVRPSAVFILVPSLLGESESVGGSGQV